MASRDSPGRRCSTSGSTPSAADRPGDLRVVLVHAFNPYGFSWVRRVNEDNVDLNRNFVDWSQPPPANEDYGGLAHLLVPDDGTTTRSRSTTLQLLAYAEEVGFARLQEVVSGGQYTPSDRGLLRRRRTRVVASLARSSTSRTSSGRRTTAGP